MSVVHGSFIPMGEAASVAGFKVAYDEAGNGSPVLLLHGFPQTRVTWRKVLPALAENHRVIAPDLPGYGDSDRLAEGPAGFDKHRVAAHLIDFMHLLGHEKFAVIGHDRGGLVAFRAALDSPETITHLGVIDILPTVDNWAALIGVGGVFAFHLFLLAQPTDLPEGLIGAAPDVFFGHFFDTWTRVPGAIDAVTREHYLSLLRRPDAIHAICDDYRASAFLDAEQDARDQRAGRALAMPVLAAWQDPGDQPLPFDPQQIWSSWASTLITRVLPGGHFLPEETPEQLIDAVNLLLQHSDA